MAHEKLQTILTDIQSLDPIELQQVRQAIDERLKAQEERGLMSRFVAALREERLLIRSAAASDSLHPARRLIHVQGQPVSQTIIEERR